MDFWQLCSKETFFGVSVLVMQRIKALGDDALR